MKRPIAIQWKNTAYIKEGYKDYCFNRIHAHVIDCVITIVSDIVDYSEFDETFYVPIWKIIFDNGDYLKIENMQNVLVFFSDNEDKK